MLELEMLEKHKNLKKLERLYKVFQKKFKQQILSPDKIQIDIFGDFQTLWVVAT